MKMVNNNSNSCVCRLCLCLSQLNETIDLDGNRLYILHRVFPGMKIDLVQTPKICLKCLKKLEVSYFFKDLVEHNDYKIKLNTSFVANAEVRCRLCLKEQTDNKVVLLHKNKNNYPYEIFRTMTEIATIELNFDVFKNPVMCNPCWETVKDIYKFKKECFKTEEKLRSLLKTNYSDLSVLTNEQISIIMSKDISPVSKDIRNNNNNEVINIENDDLATSSDSQDVIIQDSQNITQSTGSGSSRIRKANSSDCVSVSDTEDEGTKGQDKISKNESQSNGTEIGKDKDNKIDLTDNHENSKKNVVNDNNKTNDKKKSEEVSKGNTVIIESIVLSEDTSGPVSNSSTASNECKTPSVSPTTQNESPVLPPKTLWFINIDKKYHCVLCSYNSPLKLRLFKHFEELHFPELTSQTKVKCHFCDLYLTEKIEDVKAHLETEHFSEIPEKLQSKNLVQNVKSSETKIDVPMETESFKDVELKHVEQDEGKQLKCTVCEFITTKNKYLTVHMKKHALKSQEKFRCMSCRFVTYIEDVLKRHKQTKHSEKLKCSSCDYVTWRSRCLALHEQKHLSPRNSQLESTDNTKEIKCKECEYITFEQKNLIRHMRKHSLNDDSKNLLLRKESVPLTETKKEIKCKHCDYMTSEQRFMTRHMKKHTSSSDSTNVLVEKSMTNKRKKIKCSKCDFLTFEQKYMTLHMRKHLSKKNLKPVKTNLQPVKTNLKSVKTNVKPLKTNVKLVKTNVKPLKINLKPVKTNLKPINKIKCAECNFVTSERKFMSVHMKNHSLKISCKVNEQAAIQNRRIECGECDYVSFQKEDMISHMKKHISFNKVGNKCQKCLWFCQNPELLEKHILGCGSQTESSNTNVKETGKQSSLEIPGAIQTTSNEKAKRFFCKVCKKGFKYQYMCVNHMESHKTVKKYFCGVCQKGFTALIYLKNHIKRHSKKQQH